MTFQHGISLNVHAIKRALALGTCFMHVPLLRLLFLEESEMHTKKREANNSITTLLGTLLQRRHA